MEENEHSSYRGPAEKTEEPLVSENAETRPEQVRETETSEEVKENSPAYIAAKRREAFHKAYASGTASSGNSAVGDQTRSDTYWQSAAGRDPQEAYHRQMPAKQDGNPETFGIIGMICGVISIPAAFSVFLGLALGIVGIVCSAVARRRGEQTGTATAGLVTGIIGVVLSLIVLLGFIVLVLGITGGASYYYYGY